MRNRTWILLALPLLAVGCGPTSGGLVNPNPAMTNPSPEKPAVRTDMPGYVPEKTPAEKETSKAG